MNKKTLQSVLQITQECLARYWQLDPEYALSYCDDDIIWIGSVQSEFMLGKEETKRDFYNNMKELKPCHMLEQEFFVAQNCGNACTIVGRYLTTTDDSVDYFLQVQQRCTFVWEKTNEGFKIKHLHISNPMGELKVAEGELFVNTMGKMAQEYLMNHIRTLEDKKQLIVTDNREITHFLMLSEVVYATANGRNCLIYTMSGQEIYGRISLTDFLAAVGDRFTPVHRSYAINNDYISRIQKYEVVMMDGSKIPIPAKKYKEVRDALISLHDIPTE